MDLKKLISGLGKNLNNNIQQKTKYGDNKVQGNQIAETINNFNFDPNNIVKLQEMIELSMVGVNPEIKEKILPIDKLISDGKNHSALEKYISLYESDEFQTYSKNEKFLIYNGILNCNVNLNASITEIDKWSIKIEALGDVQDLHKYYYIKAIWKYNNGELKIAKALNSKAISKDSNYTNALSFDILIRIRMNTISYEDATIELKNILNGDLSIKDISRTYGILADISLINEKYNESLEYYRESNDYVKGFFKELGIAISLYHLSIKKVRPDGMVDFQNIDFEILKKSQANLEQIYENKSEDFVGHSANVCITYLFNIYSLTAKFDKTIRIIEEIREVLDFSNADITRLVVQAQVTKKIYDEEVFGYLNEYDVIKYKSFYLEICEEYQMVYDILLPAIEGKYSPDKLLRLSFLNCLQNLNNYNDYLKYYKRFQKTEFDEVLLMNYIEYLEKLEKEDEMIEELHKLKVCLSNPFIAVVYMKTLIRHNLYDDLDEFFDGVDKGIYPIIEENMSMVIYDRLMSYLKRSNYTNFYSVYEQLDLNRLREAERLILKVNYYNAKGEYANCGRAYFELYEFEKNPNDLMKAIQNMIIANEIPVAEMYLEYVNPMEIEQPEIYYMYSAMILKERNKLSEAFSRLEEYKDFVIDLNSPFHQFYFGFNMNNGRTEEAMKYIGKYYAKNPNPDWFQVITHEENETGEKILEKLKSVAGSPPDYNEINNLYYVGLLGISVYSKVANRRFEDILCDNRFPLNKINITNENVEVSIRKAESLSDSIIVDVNTLIILSKVNALDLLNAFSRLCISQDSYTRLKEMERELVKNISKTILDYIDSAMHVEILPVDINIKITSDKAKLLPEDTMSSLSLSNSMGIAFLNIETSLEREFNAEHLVNINTFFFKLRILNPDLAERIAIVRRDLRKERFNFISFEASDIINVYRIEGIEGIKPFVILDKGSIYNTYLPQYVQVLIELEKELDVEEFEVLLSYFIRFFDKYLGKSRYYLANLGRHYVTIKYDADTVIQNCNLRTIFWFLRKANMSEVRLNLFRQFVGQDSSIEELTIMHNFIVKNDRNNKMTELRKKTYERIQTLEYVDALKHSDYLKVSQILSFVAQFFVQILVAFNSSNHNSRTLELIYNNLELNTKDDIEYLIQLFEDIKEKDNAKDSPI